MDATAIHETAQATLAGTMAFPQIVAKLIEAGVEYYHGQGACVVTAITYEDLPAVAAELDIEALRENIHDSQQHGQHYRAFTVRAMKAGVQSYFAFLRGKCVTYLGRGGDQHTEWFPGAGPKTGS